MSYESTEPQTMHIPVAHNIITRSTYIPVTDIATSCFVHLQNGQNSSSGLLNFKPCNSESDFKSEQKTYSGKYAFP